MVKEMEHGNGLGERRKARRICYPQIKRKCDAIRSSKFEIKKLEAVGDLALFCDISISTRVVSNVCFCFVFFLIRVHVFLSRAASSGLG